MNGWLLSLGPKGGPSAVYDRRVAQALSCSYSPYSDDNGWLCQYCANHIRARHLINGSSVWRHLPCQGQGSIIVPWLHTSSYTAILYNYHARHCARADAIDDVRKLVIAGYDVVVDVHDAVGVDAVLEEWPQTAGGRRSGPSVICHSERDAALARTFTDRVKAVPYMAPPKPIKTTDSTIPIPAAEWLIGWYGVWSPDQNVHILIKAIADLRASGLDVGLLAVGAARRIGDKPLASNVANFAHCCGLVKKFGLEGKAALYNVEMPDAELHTVLDQCRLYCHPGIGDLPSTMMHFNYGKPVIAVRRHDNDDLEKGAYLMTDPYGVAAAVNDLATHEGVFQHFTAAAKWFGYWRQSSIVATEYLNFIGL